MKGNFNVNEHCRLQMLSIWTRRKFCRLGRVIINISPFFFSLSSELKEFTDDDLKFDENGRKIVKQLENKVGKGELLVTRHHCS